MPTRDDELHSAEAGQGQQAGMQQDARAAAAHIRIMPGAGGEGAKPSPNSPPYFPRAADARASDVGELSTVSSHNEYIVDRNSKRISVVQNQQIQSHLPRNGDPIPLVTENLLKLVHFRKSHGVDSMGNRTHGIPSHSIIVDDNFRIAEFTLNLRRLVSAYPINWVKNCKKKDLVEAIVNKRGAKDYAEHDAIHLVRLRWMDLPLAHKMSSLRPTIAINMVNEYTNFTNEMTVQLKDRIVSEWYVTFSDQKMFVFCHTDRFASEEITCVEHTCLGSVREALNDMSTNGILTEGSGTLGSVKTYAGIQTWTGRNPLDFTGTNAANFYVPHDKFEAKFRDAEVAPFTRDGAHRPTPYLIMDVPLLAKLDARGLYGMDLYRTTADANERIRNSKNTIIYSDPVTRPKNNLVCMSAPDQLFNPLRARMGPYTVYQIRFIYRTALTAFSGLVKKGRERTASPPGRKVDVVVHTGYWGCGSFGGNRRVMAYLQMMAAAAAKVDFLQFHVTKDHEGERKDFETALGWFDEAWGAAGEDLNVEQMFRDLEARGEIWSEATL